MTCVTTSKDYIILVNIRLFGHVFLHLFNLDYSMFVICNGIYLKGSLFDYINITPVLTMEQTQYLFQVTVIFTKK